MKTPTPAESEKLRLQRLTNALRQYLDPATSRQVQALPGDDTAAALAKWQQAVTSLGTLEAAQAVTNPALPGVAEGFGIAGATVHGHRAVRTGPSGVVEADPTSALDRWSVVGVSVGSALTGEQVQVVRTGPMTEAGWSWTPGLPVFVGASGALTQTVPTAPGSAWSMVIGFAEAATILYVLPMPPISLIP
jgi:hypothetical protein